MENKGNTRWIDEGNIFYPISSNVIIRESIENGVYELYKSENPNDGRVGLMKICNKFEFNFKIYDLGFNDLIDTVIKTWKSEEYKKTGKNLGVMLKDKAGAGKSIAAKLLCNKLDIPVIIIPSFIKGMVNFIESLEFEAVVLIDEADKIFNEDKNDNENILRLTEGIYNKARKLYILTVNEYTLDENIFSRPSRIRYLHSVGNLPLNTVKELIDDNLKYPDKKEDVLDYINKLENSTIDTIKALIDEVNIFGELRENNYLNIRKINQSFEVIGVPHFKLKDFKTYFESTSKGMNMNTWLSKKSVNSPEDTNEDYCYYNLSARKMSLISNTKLKKGSITNLGEIINDPDKDGFLSIKSVLTNSRKMYVSEMFVYDYFILNTNEPPSLY